MPSLSIQPPAPAPAELAQPTATRLRTVTGNKWPRKCACGCGFPIPRDPEIRYVVDFGAPRPYPAFLREHSPDYRAGTSSPRTTADSGPAIAPASALPREPALPAPVPPVRPIQPAAEEEAPTSPSPEAGRAWASGQLVFNAGSFESAKSGFADYAREGETGAQLRARVNKVLLEDLEQKVLALRALHEKLRDRLAGPSFGDVVARGHPV